MCSKSDLGDVGSWARQCNGEALQQCDLSQVQVYLIQVPYVTPSVTLAVQV